MSLNIPQINKEIKLSRLFKRLHYLEQTNSTNTNIWDLIEKTNTAGDIVITENQKNGKGRRHNKWFSVPGKSLTFSFSITLPKSEKTSLLSLIAGVSIIEVLNKKINKKITLKWPNDIYYQKRKIGGILIESKKLNKNLNFYVVGIGLNINERKKDFHEKIANIGTSLKLISKLTLNREMLLSNILLTFEKHILNMDEKYIVLNWMKHCGHKDEMINFHQNNKLITGQFSGLNSDGFAKIMIDNKLHFFNHGRIQS